MFTPYYVKTGMLSAPSKRFYMAPRLPFPLCSNIGAWLVDEIKNLLLTRSPYAVRRGYLLGRAYQGRKYWITPTGTMADHGRPGSFAPYPITLDKRRG